MRKLIRKIMKFVSDILTEDKKDNKYSSEENYGDYLWNIGLSCVYR